MKKIAVIVGTRPEASKLMPVYFALKKNNEHQVIMISTGQHREMIQQIFSFFDIVPDYDLDVMVSNQTLSSLSARLLLELGKLFEEIKPDAIVVQGDTTTCFVGALAAYYQKIKVIHVEAGLRTGDKFAPYPEEVNRKLVADIADIHFAPTIHAAKALKEENINANVFIVGNTVVDSILIARKKVYLNEKQYAVLFEHIVGSYDKLILITCHRRESFGTGLQNICSALKHLAQSYPQFSFVFPVHLNPHIQMPVKEALSDIKNVFLIDPLPYDQMVYLMNEAFLIMTDSGGIQEEAPTLKKPVIVMRTTTERPEGVEAGCSVLVGTDQQLIEKTFFQICSDQEVYNSMSRGNNPYGDGNTSALIVEVINQLW